MANFSGGLFDKGVKEAVKHGSFTAEGVLVVNIAAKDLVLAMFRPALGQHFQFDIGDLGPQTKLSADFKGCRVGQMVANDLHFIEVQGQHPVPADPQQLLIGDIEVDLCNSPRLATRHFGGKGGYPALSGEFLAIEDSETFDQFVGQQFGGNGCGGRLVELAGQKVLDRGVNRLAPGQFATKQHFQGTSRGTSFIVGNPRAKTYFDTPVKSDALAQGQSNTLRVHGGVAMRGNV